MCDAWILVYKTSSWMVVVFFFSKLKYATHIMAYFYKNIERMEFRPRGKTTHPAKKITITIIITLACFLFRILNTFFIITYSAYFCYRFPVNCIENRPFMYRWMASNNEKISETHCFRWEYYFIWSTQKKISLSLFEEMPA